MMRLRLSWTDPMSQRLRRPLLSAPIALGQVFLAMPEAISGQSVSRMVIGDRQVRDFQALIVEVEGELYLIDNGGQTYVNQKQVNEQEQLNHGDRIRIGQTELHLQIMDAPANAPKQQATRLQIVPDPTVPPTPNLQDNNSLHSPPNPPARHLPPVSSTTPSPNIGHSQNGSGALPLSHSGTPGGASVAPDTAPLPPAQPHQNLAQPPNQQAPFAPAPISPGSMSTEQSPAGLNGQHSPLPDPGLSQGTAEAGVARAKAAEAAQNPSQTYSPLPPASPAAEVPVSESTAAPQPLQLSNGAASPGCRRVVGFLFKRPCGRSNKAVCDECANGYSNHAYSADYALYEGFGRFEPGDWGYGLLAQPPQS